MSVGHQHVGGAARDEVLAAGAPRELGRAPLDLRLYLVTDTAMTMAHGITATVRSAVAGGVTVVQLRDPDASDDEFVGLGRLVRSALGESRVPLIVNDRVHLVDAIGAQGAHVGQGDLDPVRAREQLGAAAYLGLSCGTKDEVREALGLPEGTVDYLGLGPVRSTATKPDHDPPVGVRGVLDLAEQVAEGGLASVAIGGIDREVAARLRSGRLGGVAVVSAICAAPEPEAAAWGLRQVWDGAAR